MHWKLPFLICKQRCHGGGKERWTESKGAERRRVTGSLLDKDDSQGLKGGGFTAALFSVVSGLWVSLFTVPRGAPPTHTNITKTDACELGTPPNWGRCRGIGWKGACTMHRIFEPAINYNLASQRPELGEFLCWCGVQLIVFFLPVRSNVRAERRPNRGTGCLHVWYCGPSPLELLHNKKGSNGKDRALQIYTERGVFNTFFQGRWVTILGFTSCIVWQKGYLASH